MLLILIECAAEEISRSFRCKSGQIRRWVVWPVILVISERVRLQPQVLIDSKVMFLKFWMIFAKSLSSVYDKFFHKRYKFLLASPKEWISKILIRTPKRVFLSFAFDTKQFVFKVLEESFHCLLVRLQLVALSYLSRHFTSLLFTQKAPACQIHWIFRRISSSSRCKTKKSPKFSVNTRN